MALRPRGSSRLALAAGIALSSFLVLRQAPVGPQDHADQLAELRPLVQGRDVLFLGRDNFVAYELRGARAFTAVRNYYDPNYVKPDLRLKDVFRQVRLRLRHRRRPWPGSRSSSPPGPHTRAARRRRSARCGGPPTSCSGGEPAPSGPRRTLAEGADPGAILNCSSQGGRGRVRAGGTATVFSAPPVIGGRWSPGPTVEDGSPAAQALTLPAGRWAISISYDATRPIHVTAPGMDATLPANLDYRGSVPYYPVGEVRVRRSGAIRFTVSVERPPLVGRLLGTKSQAHLGAIAASAAGAGGPRSGRGRAPVPLRRACGRYLDWYRR